MDKQRILFENLKSIKDYWVETSLKSVNEDADLMWSAVEEDYKILQDKLDTTESKVAYKKVIDELIKGTMHSILVMIDGGDALADFYAVDLIEEKTKKSLKENVALHEEFYSYLFDVEE